MKRFLNQVLYRIRQHFFKTGNYLNRFQLINELTKEQQIDYVSLPRKVSQQVILNVDQNFKSFFGSLKSNKVKHEISIPKYKHKAKGRQVLIYTNQAISHKALKDNHLQLSGLNFKIKVKHIDIQQARIIKRINSYVIEVLYKVEDKEMKIDNKRYASIDLGISNLATLGSNCLKPIIINGRPLKSINQFYNKTLAKFKSEQDKHDKQYNKRKIKQLTQKRNNKVEDYLHKASRLIINHLVSNNINTLVIGFNKNWKQESDMSKKTNQNFIMIPHSRFIQMLEYKSKLEGINFIKINENYTSKCSFYDNEEICKHDEYKGKRIKRGLFKTSDGKLVNADLNGSLNILKKAVPKAFSNEGYGIEVCNTPSVTIL